MSLENALPSRYQIGDLVLALGHFGTVAGICFTEHKVAYDIELKQGGLPLLNVDIAFVEPGVSESAAAVVDTIP